MEAEIATTEYSPFSSTERSMYYCSFQFSISVMLLEKHPQKPEDQNTAPT